jgi:4-amino-4-deoxy-L-arabinose transferase-like glycosyltransferase
VFRLNKGWKLSLKQPEAVTHSFILLLIWLLSIGLDRLWYAFDRSIPAWDQAEYLTSALSYWQALQQPDWLSGEWWIQLWQITTKFPPWTFITTAPFLQIFGAGADQALWVNTLSSGILLSATYGLGALLFRPTVGLWAAVLCVLMPGLYHIRLDYLLDYPLVAWVTLSFFCLTSWRFAERGKPSWLWSFAAGITLGLALLVKQLALFFLAIPLLWAGVHNLLRRDWQRVGQGFITIGLAQLVCGPWYRTNWLLVLTGGKRATIDSAIAEGDPSLFSLEAWTYYWHQFPQLVSWPLLLVPLVGIGMYYLGQWLALPGFRPHRDATARLTHPLAWRWLAIFWVGAYGLSSLNINKDDRYVAAYLPVVAIVLAYGLTCWPDRWRGVRWGALGLSIVLTTANLFTPWSTALTPRGQHPVSASSGWPHPEIIAAIQEASPYLRSTLGVLPSTPEINQHTFSFYGGLADFQVAGRQVGTKRTQVDQDARSLDWFLTKTGAQGSIRPSIQQAQAEIVHKIETSQDFQSRDWLLPTHEVLKLYQRQIPAVQVTKIASQDRSPQVHLDRVMIPPQARPGQPIPVTYQWSGAWSQLQPGLVLLTWQRQARSTLPPTDLAAGSSQHWFHDHGLGMGRLQSTAVDSDDQFQVIERTAFLPPVDSGLGNYSLTATYLNRLTGETYPLKVPSVQLQLSVTAISQPAPELDGVTQLRLMAGQFSQGFSEFESLFQTIARLGQYDAKQDYVSQSQQAANYRLRLNPNERTLAYTAALAGILNRQVQPSIAALKHVIQLDPENPWPYAYLAFVHLYDLSPAAAQVALQPALAQHPQQPELRLLKGVADLMQFRLISAWQDIQAGLVVYP